MNIDLFEPLELIKPIEELLLSIFELSVNCTKGVTTTTTTTTCDSGNEPK